MSSESKSLSKSKLRAIFKFPCDGVPRFLIKGSVVQVPVVYSAAYEEWFRLTGGRYEANLTDPKAPDNRIWTPKGMKVIARLNAQYCSLAQAWFQDQHAAMVAARDLLKRPPVEDPAPEAVPPGTPMSDFDRHHSTVAGIKKEEYASEHIAPCLPPADSAVSAV